MPGLRKSLRYTSDTGTIVSVSDDGKKATVDIAGMRVDVKTSELSDGSDFVQEEAPAWVLVDAAAASELRRNRANVDPGGLAGGEAAEGEEQDCDEYATHG